MGTSKIAANKAVMETCYSRLVLAAPCILGPVAVSLLLDSLRLMPKNPKLRLLADNFAVAFALWHAIPIAAAVYPQQS